jgi:serine/threonine-protein kinase RsbW
MVAARHAVMEFVAPYCANEVEEVDIFLALQEALANAVQHGCGNDSSKTIDCSVVIEPAVFVITIRDPGPGFDVEAVDCGGDAAMNLNTHGRGICLMRSLMDEVIYRRGGAEVELRKGRILPGLKPRSHS